MPKIKVSLSDTDYEILNILSADEGISASDIAEQIELSESSLSKHIATLRGVKLVARHRDPDDEVLLIYLTPKGQKILEQKKSEENPNSKEVKKMAKLSFQIDDEIADDIREIAESEDQSISEFLSDLVCDALDEFYPETDEDEGPEELETR